MRWSHPACLSAFGVKYASIRSSYLASEAFFQNPGATGLTRRYPVLRRLSGHFRRLSVASGGFRRGTVQQPRCLPDASRCFPDASQMPPRCLQMPPHASRCFQMPHRCFPNASRCLPDAPRRGTVQQPRCLPDASRCSQMPSQMLTIVFYSRDRGCLHSG